MIAPGYQLINQPLDLSIYNRPKMGQSKTTRGDLRVYQQLWELEAGFEQVRRALLALEGNRTFRASEVQRFASWIEEARAARASYLTGAIEEVETKEAGRLFRLRRKQEQVED